jgi:hypothetical protein
MPETHHLKLEADGDTGSADIGLGKTVEKDDGSEMKSEGDELGGEVDAGDDG